MQQLTSRSRLLGAALSLLMAHVALGGGIEVPMQSGKAAGEADAFTAQANDPSAIFYNPSGLTQLHGTQASAGVYYLQPSFDFHSDAGQHQNMDLPSVLPHLFVESDFGLDRVRVGLGVTDVFGINEHWGNVGPLRTIDNRAQLSVINIAPTIAYRVDDHLSLGVALNVYYGSLDLKRNALLGAPPVPEGQFELKGSDWAVGVTAGVMYKIDDRNQIGAYYRSPFTLDFNGHATVTSTVIPEIGPSRATEKLNFPQSIGLGYAMKPITPLTVETDVIWTDWHTVDQLRIHSNNPAFNGQTLKADWKSGFTLRVGAEYQLCKHWFLRAGYAYGQNAVPESTFSPLVPDNSYNLGAVGLGYANDHWNVDLAYNYIDRGTRHISNSVNSPNVNGKWDNTIYGIMLTVGVKF